VDNVLLSVQKGQVVHSLLCGAMPWKSARQIRFSSYGWRFILMWQSVEFFNSH